jgi:hypothetical protein
MPSIRVNTNGIKILQDGEKIHASYYIGDGVTFEKTFQNLTKKQISLLSIDDLK